MTENVSSEVLTYLTSGIQAEISAYVFYKLGADHISDQDLKSKILHFAAEEKKHFLSLEAHYDKYTRSEKWVTYRDIMSKDGLPDIDESMGEKHIKRINKVKEANNALDVLYLALELEQEAFKLYSDACEMATTKEVQETFEFLKKFEALHVKNVEEMIATEKEK